MKVKSISLALLLIFSITSCWSQQLVQKTSDAELFQKNKQQFVGKPLKNVIQEIKPIIANVVGTLEDVSLSSNSSIGIHFLTLDEYRVARKSGKHPSIILIALVQANRTYPSLKSRDSLSTWNETLIKRYGDIIVKDISVSGTD